MPTFHSKHFYILLLIMPLNNLSFIRYIRRCGICVRALSPTAIPDNFDRACRVVFGTLGKFDLQARTIKMTAYT